MNIYFNDTVDYPFQMRSTVAYIDRLGIPSLHGEGGEDDEIHSV